MSRKFIAALSGTYNVQKCEAHGGSAGNVQHIASLAGSTSTPGASLLPAAFAKLVRQQTVQQSPQIETIKCVVHFLDDTQHIFEVDVSVTT